ncbi:MAG: hypothetical protein V9G14_19220 [Cypionkella sp.]
MIIREERIGNQRLLLGDCLAVMPTLGRFDAVVTDPPYGIGISSTADKSRRQVASVDTQSRSSTMTARLIPQPFLDCPRSADRGVQTISEAACQRAEGCWHGTSWAICQTWVTALRNVEFAWHSRTGKADMAFAALGRA